MKIVMCFFLLMVSFSLQSATASNEQEIKKAVSDLKDLNGKILISNEESTINQLLGEKTDVLESLIEQLRIAKKTQLSAEVDTNEQAFLQLRIKVNTKKGNLLAAKRDQAKLEENKARLAINQYLEYLIKSSKNYQSIEAIVSHSQALFDDNLNTEKRIVLPKIVEESSIFLELKKNYMGFLRTTNSYQDILHYVINNPRKIASVSWFQEISLLTAISYVNHFGFVQPINHKLAPFMIDTGGVVLSLVIFFLVYYSYPFIFKCTRWWIENYILDKESEKQATIYHEIRKPVQALLVVFGINLGTYAFFYKTQFHSSLEGAFFIIYSLLFIWLFFKIINSIVLVQIEKLASSNKQLRKGLFNLGVQSLKGLVVITVLAFDFSHFGISLTAIFSTLGVGGLAFALAAKDTLSNLFGGITILFDNVFRMGDWVKIGDVEGTVAEIGLRSTTIRTFDNALITIPNSLVSVASVRNWNRRAVGRRIKMHVGVTYESNMDDLRQGIDDIRNMLKNHPDIADPSQKQGNRRRKFKFASHEDTQGIKSTQLVFMDKYNDFSIDILIYCFARTVNWAEWLAVKEDVLYKIAEILQKNNLQFAYPTQVRIYRTENENDRGTPFLEEEINTEVQP